MISCQYAENGDRNNEPESHEISNQEEVSMIVFQIGRSRASSSMDFTTSSTKGFGML